MVIDSIIPIPPRRPPSALPPCYRAAIALFDDMGKPLMFDFLVAEAVSVVCRRTTQRKTNRLDLGAILLKVQALFDQGDIEFLNEGVEGRFLKVLDVIRDSTGALNFHDATLMVL